MPNCTDQTSVDTGKAAELVLAAVAGHFETTNPTDLLETHNLLVCIGAEAYNLADRSLHGDGPAMSKAAFTLAPEIAEGSTRGAYAALLREVLAVNGGQA
ncbi:hypothetical protein [Streptomyces chryseus]|uniref:hypothetical protein n=1 Tax=Streptomyces chryseus TaxID=68186 RepID=UPI00110FA7CC|nr:hypothetical protein [Streptomyces chryseus]GGW99781.1 hypothetical protein GCM10010353_14330 [Streptomyces chryseus]